jgi:methionyl aminopeptidase
MVPKMEEKELENYRKAGKIASEVREWSRELVKPGAKALDIAEKVEAKIFELGGQLAFPVNVCINDVTAHYSPKFNDETALQKTDLVSIDMGVHLDGYIADTAYSVDLSKKHGKLIKADEEALAAAIEIVKPGVLVAEIGKAIYEVITSAGYRPIENLTGHEMKQYELHAGLSIPSIEVPHKLKVEEGMVLAIEPFATDGLGRVIESKQAEIFSLMIPRPTRNRDARTVIEDVTPRKGLPFAERWLTKKIPPLRLDLAMRDLLANGTLRAYPTLHEKEKGVVSQFEHTVIVTADGCEVTTK